MRSELKTSLEHLKSQMLETTEHLPAEEREEFYREINEWTYDEYEKCLLVDDPEMQDYEED